MILYSDKMLLVDWWGKIMIELGIIIFGEIIIFEEIN